MEKRTYIKISKLTPEELKIHKRKQNLEVVKRYRARKKIKDDLEVETKTPENIRKRKNDLAKDYRKNKTNEVLTQQKMIEYICNKYEDCNKHYLNRYMRLIFSDYSTFKGKTEKHHVLPKSIFPDFKSNKTNLVKIPLRVHYLAHWILVKMLPSCGKMALAFVTMNSQSPKPIASRLYEHSKIVSSKYLAELNNSRVINGSFHGLKANSRTIKDGTHNFLGDDHPVKKAIRNGEYWGSGERHYCHQKLLDNTHHLQGDRHPSRKTPPWKNYKRNVESLNVWENADTILELYKENEKIGADNLKRKSENKLFTILSRKAIQNFLRKVRSGWIPLEDAEWLLYKNNNKGEK